jgi:hypothetical protein
VQETVLESARNLLHLKLLPILNPAGYLHIESVEQMRAGSAKLALFTCKAPPTRLPLVAESRIPEYPNRTALLSESVPSWWMSMRLHFRMVAILAVCLVAYGVLVCAFRLMSEASDRAWYSGIAVIFGLLLFVPVIVREIWRRL